MGAMVELLVILGVVVVGVLIIVFMLVPILKAIGVIIGRIFGFIGATIRDLARAIGAVIAAGVISVLCVGCIVIGRWSAAAHFGRAVKAELATGLLCIYRFFIANPLRLIGLEAMTEGLERRLPQVVADAPAADPSRSTSRAKFEGYTISGTLAPGGSGARLYIADPDPMKRAAFERAGLANVGQVVIKSFALDEGSSLPQIVRESRALDAARRLGLILDHELTPQRFFYVMRYVPGESLTQVTKRLHATAGPDGLGPREVRNVLSYAADLLATLAAYHRGGLWHKDVKPDNIIVDTRQGGTGRAYLVDFGLLGSLKSAMTLTTHGTEYFRDPELVRLAVKGVKVHEVDGTRFDVYGAGAVLFAMIEDGFPPHGGLSQVARRCPDALRWIIRRAMADYDKRYAGAEDMLADVRAALAAPDPYSVKPVDLPSVRGTPSPASSPDVGPAAFAGAGAVPAFAAAPAVAHAAGARAPKVQILNWWTGKARVEIPTAEAATPAAAAAVAQQEWIERKIGEAALAPGVPLQHGFQHGHFNPDVSRIRHGATRRSAQEQLAAARDRVEHARARAQERAKRLRAPAPQADTGPNVGVGLAIVVVAGLAIGAYSMFGSRGVQAPTATASIEPIDATPLALPGGSIVLTGGADMTAPIQTAELLLHSKSSVLVVVDALPPVPQSVSSAASRVAESLAGAGATIVGLGDSGEDDVEWLAAARSALGANSAEVADAAERFRSFFDAHDDAAAIVWISANPGVGVDARVFVSPSADPEDAQTIAVGVANAVR